MNSGDRMDWIKGPLLLLFAFSLLSAGCLGDTSGEDQNTGNEVGTQTGATGNSTSTSTDVDALWDGRTELTVIELESPPEAKEADVLCTMGGGPYLPRTEELVLPGTSHLEVTVRIEETYTGYQVGYVLDSAPADHEADQENITWLEPVEPGEGSTFEIPVEPNQIEHPGGGMLWAFYGRVNPGADEACYTGVGYGVKDIVVKAVRGP